MYHTAPESLRASLWAAIAAGWDSDQVRTEELAGKARAGSLSPEEEREIENYERVGHYLAILQSKARVALRGLSAS